MRHACHLRYSTLVLSRTLTYQIARKRGHLHTAYALLHARSLHCDGGWKCATSGSSIASVPEEVAAPAQAEAADLRKQMEELRTQLQRNEEMVRWLNNQVRSADKTIVAHCAGNSGQQLCAELQPASVILKDLSWQALALSASVLLGMMTRRCN